MIDESGFVLRSPSGVLTATLRLTREKRLRYQVKRGDAVVVEDGDIGITADGVDLGDGVAFEDIRQETIYETYKVFGGHSDALNHCNAYRFSLRHAASGEAYELQARAYDDGFAFRYALPREGTTTVQGEASSWTLPAGSRVWLFERNNGWKLKSYAGEWISADAEELHTVSGQGPVQGTPLVAELPDGRGYAAIAEAALYNYSGMRLEAIGRRAVRANFTEGDAGFAVEGAVLTPWRVAMAAPDLDGLVNSDLITNLNPAPSAALFSDTSYIRPGRSAWRWWSLGTGTPEQERETVDRAAALGFEYTTVDEGWEAWPEPWADLRRLTDYAKGKHVGVFVWKRSKEIDDPREGWRTMREFFDKAKDAGAVGLKIDFIDNESKAAIDFEIAALRLAAERRLMINFHGISKPTGESRTYPNEISREGIRGLELNKMKEGPIPAWHNAALPFTRFVAGHGDYTPVGFSNPGETTYAHQLATMVAFTSPLQVVAENPAFLLEEAAARPALDVLKSIPSVWDETRALPPSAIGELAVLARRSGEAWFLGVLNGKAERTTVRLPLSFLDDGAAYDAVEIVDRGPGSMARKEGMRVASRDAVDIVLEPNGGYVAVLRKA
ncbi:glycoside hydrolase family 97 protein [Paenibacillus antri]|uniref:Glycoside hydrolase family 97 protein n=1 Tax=Paenibacillus antri TaxID=2582848 RepID=A0A5R9FY85_9BACL|nr:glycoside hydrolase family 97 protein [Paenibacillus antri]TLS49012.1 glycoside hydrolase family 97 protein [Paenibacillus antri]